MKKTSLYSLLLFSCITICTVFLATEAYAFTCGNSISKDGKTYGSLIAEDGQCWLDRNLGASRVAITYNDSQAYGWLFQWGRGADGHQIPTSNVTSATSSTDTPGHSYFISNTDHSPGGWRIPQNDSLWQGVNGVNNPCPTGFRVPTQVEWINLYNAAGISNYNAAHASSLKLSIGGDRWYYDGTMKNQTGYGYYWSSTVYGTDARTFVIYSSGSNPSSYWNRGHGAPVRCILDTSIASIPSLTTSATSSITSTQATGNGEITDTGEEDPERFIEWGTESGTYTNSCSAGTGGIGTYSCTLTDLQPSTTYYVRAYATNSAGTTYAEESSFTTNAFTCGNTLSYGGQTYNTVQIGDQCWFKENLNIGSMLASVSTLPSNNSLIEKWCYNNSSAICATDGGLYTWAEANQLDPSCNTASCTVPDENQGICPTGWHIPSDDEFKTLEMELGMTQIQADETSFRGTDQGRQMKVSSAGGTNSSGFSAIMTGWRYTNSTYNYRGLYTFFHTATENDSTQSMRRYLRSDFTTVSRSGTTKATGLSVRCLQNAPTTPQDLTIQNPTPTDIQQAVTENYFSINTGTIDNTTEVSTNANITLEIPNTQATLPTTTTITETTNGSMNFQNFTLEPISVKDQQPTSRTAFRLGIEGTNLTFSQPITITTNIGEAFNNQTLDILYQNEGESTWNTQTTCTVQNGECTFQTDHATIYTINGIHQSEGDTPMNLNVEVQSTLSMDCYDTSGGTGDHDVSLGTTTNPGTLTAGTPATGRSTCDVTTNDTEGYYLTLADDNGAATTTLTHTDPHTATIYEIQDLTYWDQGAMTTENWSAPTTKGLGFSVISFPDTNLTNNTFNGIWTNTNQCPEGTNPDTNDYAGIPDAPETIAAVTQYEPNTTTTNICYKVDVPPSQPSGIYQGSVTYTATSDASSYLN